MRFAPPNPLRIADRASGLNSLSVRSYNERLVLSLLLQNEITTRLEIGERTGLSAQTVSVIVRSLEQEGLVTTGEVQRGRVGPPTTPLLLNPEGAFSVGISVGYRTTHVVLVDFVGNVRYQNALPHKLPENTLDRDEVSREVRNAIASMSIERQGRIAGVGLGIPSPTKDVTQHDDLHLFLENEIRLPVFVQNDIAAAAAGENIFGAAKRLPDFLFFYLGAKLHSRLILNHQIYNGNSPFSLDAGVLDLESALSSKVARKNIWTYDYDWRDIGYELDVWSNRCADILAQSVQSLSQFVDIKTVVLSSFTPAWIREELCLMIEKRLPLIRAIPGKTSPAPKAVGAAALSYNSRFMVE
jgi:DNA-binding transcriptional ArsR family regulator